MLCYFCLMYVCIVIMFKLPCSQFIFYFVIHCVSFECTRFIIVCVICRLSAAQGYTIRQSVIACCNKMEHSSSAFVDQNIFCGFLEMETKPNSGVFHRRFLRLDPSASTLEFFVDRQEVYRAVAFLRHIAMHRIRWDHWGLLAQCSVMIVTCLSVCPFCVYVCVWVSVRYNREPCKNG